MRRRVRGLGGESRGRRPGEGPGLLRRLAAAWLALAMSGAAACGAAEDAPGEGGEAAAPPDSGEAYVRPSADGGELTAGDTLPGHPSWTAEDWTVLREAASWALERGVDTLPVSERVAALGRRFVGTEYVPRTLDPPGPERLVVNLRALDCVTFVENMLALAHFVDGIPGDLLDDRDAAIERYEGILIDIRYRDGRMAGYASRLHYFTEWLHDNEEKGFVEVVTEELGGVPDPEPIDFMTEHRESYRQLTELENFEAIERIEERLSARTRYYIPQDRVKEVQDRIRTGDVIGATSTLDGLDIAHTGIALWQGDTLHLMHAPLVGEDVQISERSLADRLLAIEAQDGIVVARPLEPGSNANAN